MLSNFASLKAELKTLERKTMRQVKVVQKLNNKKKRKGTRAPSGFVKPAPISDELANFLGKEKGSEMARTDVTREINKYIRAHQLQDKDNGRKINPDKLLCQLLKVEPEVNLTYFNLQRYMGPHFPKQTKPVDAQVAPVAPLATAS
jgi:chromatin remodeling complex protein RSC6